MEIKWPKVLLVDDDRTMLRLLERMLTNAGYQVRKANDADEALTMIEENCPHFIITDWLMPGMGGPELCQAVRRLDLPHYVYVLMVTSKSEASDIVEALQSGADDFLVKPVMSGELVARMQAGARVLNLEHRLSEAMRADPLTGVLTRRAFSQEAEREFRRAQRHQSPLACVMIDVDFFKKINDTYGHPTGDAMLKEVAAVIQSNCRGSGDMVGRYGGEEFCALLPETTEENAEIWAERVRKQIAKFKLSSGGEPLSVTASLGVSQLLDDTADVCALVDMADQALLVAKQTGRDRTVRFSSLNDSISVEGNENLFDAVLARDVMSSLVSCLQEHETAGQAADLFLRFRFNACPVVDSQGKLSGILSERDVLSIMTDPDCWNRPVREIMKRNAVCYEEEAPAKSVYDFLCRVSLRRVVVIKDGCPTGIISRGGLLRWYRNWLSVHGKIPLSNIESDEALSSSRAESGDGQTSRQTLAKTADIISQQAQDIRHALAVESTECLPLLIDRASKIQELINDVLSDSRSLLTST